MTRQTLLRATKARRANRESLLKYLGLEADLAYNRTKTRQILGVEAGAGLQASRADLGDRAIRGYIALMNTSL